MWVNLWVGIVGLRPFIISSIVKLLLMRSLLLHWQLWLRLQERPSQEHPIPSQEQ
jgi:hypothetical protein